MDRSAASVDSGDVDSQTPPETTTTRPNPFEDDAASARKRRRTSTSGSMSPAPEGSSDDDAGHKISHDIIERHGTDTALQEAMSTPDDQTDNVHTPVASDSSPSLDPSSQLTLSLRRIINDQRSEAMQTGDRIMDSRSNSPILEQACAPGDDRHMMAQPDDETSSSDPEEVITPAASFPFRRQTDDLHDPVIRLTQDISNGKLPEELLQGHLALTADTRAQH